MPSTMRLLCRVQFYGEQLMPRVGRMLAGGPVGRMAVLLSLIGVRLHDSGVLSMPVAI